MKLYFIANRNEANHLLDAFAATGMQIIKETPRKGKGNVLNTCILNMIMDRSWLSYPVLKHSKMGVL